MQDTEKKIPNLFLKLAYSELLLSYKTEDLVPLVQNASVSSRKLIENAWQEDELVSVEDNALIIEGFSKWILMQGENLDSFTDRMFEKMKRLNSVPKRAVLRSYLPYIHDFYEMEDQRQGFLRYIEKRNLFQEHFRFVEGSIEGNNRHDYMTNSDSGSYHPAAVYSNWMLRSLQEGANYLELPPFEQVRVISCQFTAEEALLGRLSGCMDGDTFYVSGIAVGKVVKFAECLAGIPKNLGFEKFSGKPCLRIDADVVDSFTGTHLLYKGRYYGAHASVSKFIYAKNIKVKNPFLNLISSLVQEEYNVWPPVQKAHEELLRKINHVAEIVYYEADDSISVNGKHLMRNVPARILRNVLREYTKTGREEFENREFKRDPEICIDPVNPNFESRLNRVVDHLEKVSDVLSLNRHRRGGFRFEPHCHIDFREEAPTVRKNKK